MTFSCNLENTYTRKQDYLVNRALSWWELSKTPQTPLFVWCCWQRLKAPSNLFRLSPGKDAEDGDGEFAIIVEQVESSMKSFGKKTLEELKEQPMKRGRREKERERALLSGKKNRVERRY